MEALKTIGTVNGNQTKNDFKEMNTQTAQSSKVKDVEALREKFDKEIETTQASDVDKSYLLEHIKDDRIFDIMFQEYNGNDGVVLANTFATLQAVRRIDDYFRTDATEPRRTARAINKLLDGIDPYIKEKVVNEFAKDDYCIAAEDCNNPIWLKIKSIYDIELLAPKEANN